MLKLVYFISFFFEEDIQESIPTPISGQYMTVNVVAFENTPFNLLVGLLFYLIIKNTRFVGRIFLLIFLFKFTDV